LMSRRRLLEFLELEEWVGQRWHRWASRTASYPHYPEAMVRLRELEKSLAVFFRLSGGDPGLELSVISARTSGHRLRWRQRLGFDEELVDLARVDEQHLLLPPHIDLLPDRDLNRDLYFWLAAYLAAARALPFEPDSLRRDILALREVRRSSDMVLAQYPGLGARHDRLCSALLALRPRRQLPRMEAALEAAIRRLLGDSMPLGGVAKDLYSAVLDDRPPDEWHAPKGYRPPLPVPLWGEAVMMGTAPRASGEQEDIADDSVTQTGPEGRRKASRRRQTESERDDPLVFNRFEKMLSIAEMVNLNRLVDDEEDEDAHKSAEQLDEITVSPHRKKAAAKIRLELDLPPDAAAGAPLSGKYRYPEWDYRKGRYLLNHCQVFVELYPESEQAMPQDEATRRRILSVRRQFEALRPGREVLRGQLEGTELDMDAVVRAHCDLAATGTASDGLYLASLPRARDLAVDILVDVSLSTDAWLEDRRVIDVAREALLALAHGLALSGDDYAIHCFTSRRRERVWVSTLKSFDEALGERVERRIQALEPGHYTRMGPAIRHCTELLAQRPQRHRLLLILSDGKPNDTDYYEGRYAIEDTRRAILDARQQEVQVFAVTVDREAEAYLPRLFGRGGWAMVSRPEHLPQALPAIYRRVTSR
jgi:nitric oxide reductase NorD protein